MLAAYGGSSRYPALGHGHGHGSFSSSSSSPPAAHMNPRYGGRRKRRVSRYLLTCLVVAVVLVLTYWKQQSIVPGVLKKWDHLGHGEGGGSNDNGAAGGGSSSEPARVGGSTGVPPQSDSEHEHEHGSQEPQEGEQEGDGEVHQALAIPGQPVVGKMTISFGETEEVYNRAIRSHEYHNKQMGYPQYSLRERLLPGLWSKHAYIFSVIAQELSKPEGQRLQWLMWLDRDTVLMNPLIPLEIFLPPAGFEKIHLLTTNDRHGLNNGVFLVKVCDWSLKLFSTAMTLPHYRPEIKLQYTEQSAMEETLKIDWYGRSRVRVPQRWFNAFPPPTKDDKMQLYHARPGQLLFHFASNRDGRRPERMNQWMDVADRGESEWRRPLNETEYAEGVGEYWDRLRKGEDQESIVHSLEGR